MDGKPIWNDPRLNKAQYSAMICLLSLRNTKHETTDEIDAEDHITDSDTETPCCLTASSKEGLKKRFLDRLAEVMSTKKGSAFVTSTAMKEDCQSATVYVAMNGRINLTDMTFTQQLAHLLAVISRCGTFI